jgi:hypothetical protein
MIYLPADLFSVPRHTEDPGPAGTARVEPGEAGRAGIVDPPVRKILKRPRSTIGALSMNLSCPRPVAAE